MCSCFVLFTRNALHTALRLQSLGLVSIPKIKIQGSGDSRAKSRKLKNSSRKLQKLKVLHGTLVPIVYSLTHTYTHASRSCRLPLLPRSASPPRRLQVAQVVAPGPAVATAIVVTTAAMTMMETMVMMMVMT